MLAELYPHLGFLAELSSLLAAVICGFQMQVILRERTPMVQLQRLSLAVLAIALVANGSFYYPSWALIDGHRPTGAFVDMALFVYMAVVALRGWVKYRNSVVEEEKDEDRIRV
jgi:tellurite resistance protein TehA-like permease